MEVLRVFGPMRLTIFGYSLPNKKLKEFSSPERRREMFFFQFWKLLDLPFASVFWGIYDVAGKFVNDAVWDV